MQPKLQHINALTSSSITVRRDVIPYMDQPLHYHTEYEIVYIEKSYGVRLIGNHIGNFSDGDLMFISPNLPHVWKNDRFFYENQHNHKAIVYVINFREDALTEQFFDLPEFTQVKKIFILGKQGILFNNNKEKAKISKLVKQVYHSTGIKRLTLFFNTLEALTQAKDYILLSGPGYASSTNGTETDRINKVITYLMENYSREINLDEISSFTNLNKSSFCRFFKARTKKTYTQFLNEIRIVHACKLLTNGTMKISEVCYETGYNNISHFNRQFKLFTGSTAKEYSKKYRINASPF